METVQRLRLSRTQISEEVMRSTNVWLDQPLQRQKRQAVKSDNTGFPLLSLMHQTDQQMALGLADMTTYYMVGREKNIHQWIISSAILAKGQLWLTTDGLEQQQTGQKNDPRQKKTPSKLRWRQTFHLLFRVWIQKVWRHSKMYFAVNMIAEDVWWRLRLLPQRSAIYSNTITGIDLL